jgi:DNA-binding CsgD family transcriptional regulator
LHDRVGLRLLTAEEAFVSERWSPSEVTAALPLREVVEGDPDRGVVLYDSTLRLVYANPAARKQLEDADGVVLTGLRDALASFRDRLDRSESVLAPGDVVLAAGAGRLFRAVISPVRWVGGRWFVVRLGSPVAAGEPNIRRLQTRFRLTLREAEVALDVSKGLANAEVARHLGITEKTVKNVLMEVFQKATVRNRVELALRCHDAAIGLGPVPGA